MANENSIWHELMIEFNKAKRFCFPFTEREVGINNGIYILFEKGEVITDRDRVTRIGINREQGNFISRLKDHFLREIQRNSVFRKHFGRCILNKKNDSYLKYWDCKYKTKEDKMKYTGKVNLEYERIIESEISSYVRSYCSFCVIQIEDRVMRHELENNLVATFARSGKNKPTEFWMGNYHPTYSYFKETGLWNVQGRDGDILSKEKLRTILSNIQYYPWQRTLN